MIRTLILLFLFPGFTTSARAQDDSPQPNESDQGEGVGAAVPAPARTAERAELKELLKAHKAATKSKDGAIIAAALEALVTLDNPDVLKLAKAAFSYKLSKVDQKWAADEALATGFEGDEVEIERLLHERRAVIEVAATHVLAYQPIQKAGPILVGAFEDNDLRTHRPLTAKAILEVFARFQYVEATDSVVRELNELRSPEMARSCIALLVDIDTKSEKAFLALCDLLAGPAPANVDDPTNPPAAYWEARWRTWTPLRRDVQAALRKLTGRDWKADAGTRIGEADAARKWVRDNAKKLGLK